MVLLPIICINGQFVTGLMSISDSVRVLWLQTNKSQCNSDKFYSGVEQALDVTKPRDITIVMEDFNAKINRESVL